MLLVWWTIENSVKHHFEIRVVRFALVDRYIDCFPGRVYVFYCKIHCKPHKLAVHSLVHLELGSSKGRLLALLGIIFIFSILSCLPCAQMYRSSKLCFLNIGCAQSFNFYLMFYDAKLVVMYNLAQTMEKRKRVW